MLLVNIDTGGVRLSEGNFWPLLTSMAPDLTNPQYKKTLSSSTRTHHQPASPVAGRHDLVRVHPKSGPLPAVTKSKKSRLIRFKARKHPTEGLSVSPSAQDPTTMAEIDDKKRNKLGYQRISIACAHCRRRKIRCLVAEDDPQHRCANCIRLGKDCVFYPVDQQAAMESRQDTGSESNYGSAHTPSTTMSPAHSAIDGRHDGYNGLPMTGSSQGFRGVPITPNGSYAPSDMSMYPHGASATPWSLQDEYRGTAIPVAGHPNMGPPFSRYANGNMRADYAPFPGALDPEQAGIPRAGSMVSDPDSSRMSWSQHPHVGRSMSYPDYPNDGLYSLNAQHGVYQHISPVQMPGVSGSMNGYEVPHNYALTPDQRSMSIPEYTAHSSMPGSGPWFLSPGLMLGRDDDAKPVLSPQ